MEISQNGINLIKQFEGCSLKAYKCPAGVWTIGYGHTKNVTEGQTITQAQAINLLKQDLKIYENYVNNTGLNLNQNEFDALVSFCYNCGPGNLKKLTYGRTLNQIADALLLYTKANGVVLNGLVRRRKAERELFMTDMPNKIRKVRVTAYGLNVRAGIGTGFKIIRVLKKGAVVPVSQVSKGWGKIEDGWISLKYTSEI